MASLLQTAGSSVKYLTNDPPNDLQRENGPIEARKTAFRASTTDFFTLFTRIRDALGAEADALENAKLIPAKPPPPAAILREDEQGITNGGLGSFDVGWLNSRSDSVMRGKEKEIWAEVRKMLETMDEDESKREDG